MIFQLRFNTAESIPAKANKQEHQDDLLKNHETIWLSYGYGFMD
jgi:hypothetical protein